MSNRITPNQREIIAAQSTITGKSEYLTSTNGFLNTNASVSISGSAIPVTGATTAIVTAIVDGSGNQITSFGGGTQYTDGATPPTHPIGPTLEFNNAGTWVTVGTSNPLPITGSLSVGGTVDEATFTAGVSTFSSSGGVFNDSIAALSSGQQGAHRLTPNRADHVNLRNNSGTEIGTATTPLQVSLANTGANTNKLLVTADPITFASAQPVTQSGSWAVTANAGTNLNTSLLALESGGNLAVLAGGVSSSVYQGNVKQINGVIPLMGNGVTGTGSQRVTIASDNTAFSVNATLSAETTKVIGTVNQGTSPWVSNISQWNGGTVTAAASLTDLAASPTSPIVGAQLYAFDNGTGYNRLGLLNSGTDGQTGGRGLTVGNLLFNGSTYDRQRGTSGAANVALNAETTKVIGTVNQGTSPWVVGQSTASSLNATVVQGTAAALSAGWPVLNGEASDTTGTFTNATQTTSVTASSLDGYGNVLISINGTYGTATAVFEGSDDGGTTWYGISEADRTDSNIIESGYTTLTNTLRAWQISNPGWDSVRVRSTAVASGTVNVRISPSAAPTSAGASVSVGVALPTGANTIGAVTGTGTFAVQTTSDTPGTGATNLGKAEDAASASGDTGVFTLGVRNDTVADTTNTNGDYTQFSTDVKGHVLTANAPRLLKVQQQTTITSSTAETTVLTAVASTFLDVYGIIVANSSASATKVTFKDATAGTTRIVMEIPAGDQRGFMLPMDGAYPQAAINNNWTATCGTSVASIDITMFAVKNI